MKLVYASYLLYGMVWMVIMAMMKSVDSEDLLKKEPIGQAREAVWLQGSTLGNEKNKYG